MGHSDIGATVYRCACTTGVHKLLWFLTLSREGSRARHCTLDCIVITFIYTGNGEVIDLDLSHIQSMDEITKVVLTYSKGRRFGSSV